MPSGRGSTGSRLTGVPSLIAFARTIRLQKSEFTPESRTNMAQSTFSLMRAKYGEDPKVRELIEQIETDISACREEFATCMTDNVLDPDESTYINQVLDGIEYRIDQIIVMTKVIDSAALQEMMVPE